MRILLGLAITVSVLLAFGVACAGDAEEALVTPTPVSESEGEAGGWEEEEGNGEEGEGTADEGGGDIAGGGDGPDEDPGAAEEEERREACPDSDMDTVCNDDDDDDDNDGFSDGDETVVGSDPFDAASVPENHVINPGSCMDGVDNDGDGFIDGPDPNCPSGPRGLSANLGVTPHIYDGPCPVDFTFSGIVTLAAGRGTVTYAYVRSDTGVGPARTLTFDSPGTQNVSTGWNIGNAGEAFHYSGWMAIRILEPEEHESNRAEFTVTCED